MYAIIATGGKQYKVSEGDVIKVERLGAEAGEEVVFDQVLADLALFTAAEQNSVRQNDCHNAVRFDMIEIVQKKSVIGFPFRREPVGFIARIGFFICRVPVL